MRASHEPATDSKDLICFTIIYGTNDLLVDFALILVRCKPLLPVPLVSSVLPAVGVTVIFGNSITPCGRAHLSTWSPVERGRRWRVADEAWLR